MRKVIAERAQGPETACLDLVRSPSARPEGRESMGNKLTSYLRAVKRTALRMRRAADRLFMRGFEHAPLQ
jgi:hypothetical protein